MKIDQRRLDILNYLLDYRGLNAKQMTQFVYQLHDTMLYTSNVKQVQREIKSLVDRGLVTLFKYSEPIVDEDGFVKNQNVSMYYLSKEGYTYMLQHFNVIPGRYGTGFLYDEKDTLVYGDIPYTTYTPPQKLVEHHMMGIRTFITLFLMCIPHRNNLYAAKTVGDKKLRPDAEMKINGMVYFLEFDRATENHEKLVEKFQNYAAYLATLSEDELKKIGKIIFIVDEYGKDNRWNNILAAFLKGIGSKYRSWISVAMCTELELLDFLYIEKDVTEISEGLSNIVMKNGQITYKFKYGVCSYINSKGKAELVTIGHAYDSTAFLNYLATNNLALSKRLHVSSTAFVACDGKYIQPPLNLSHYQVDPLLVKDYEKFYALQKTIIPIYQLVIGDYDDEDDEF